jgi:chromosome segregation ATPase
MKIKALEVNNFIGIKEFKWNPSPGINIIEGPKGTGKSSIVESLETAFANQKRRTEVIRHGEDEATIFVETDTGLEIDRRIRNTGKADYLKLRQEGKGINSTEKELRQFLSGDIFRPLDFINMDVKEQTKIILNMIEVNWTMEDIHKWFGEEITGINYDKHILQILKDIETKLYKEREEINRQIKTLDIQCDAIKKELPPNYDGEEWRAKNIQEYYSKVSEAQKINQFIEQAKALKENFEDRVKAIEADAESQKSRVTDRFREQRADIKDIIDLSKDKINKSKETVKAATKLLEEEKKQIDINTQIEIEKAIQAIKQAAEDKKKELDMSLENMKQEQADLISQNENKISAKEQELSGLDELEKAELKAVDEKKISEVEKEKLRVGKAVHYIAHNEPIDVEPLQKQADEVAEMQSYLREWDRMKGIMDGELAAKRGYSAALTNQIETARNKPSELLKTHKLPIDGISVDGNGMIRINGTLLDGLSDGEKLEAAFKIAIQRMGDLRIICLDGFEKLNDAEKEKVIKICEDNDIQAFITITKDTTSGEFEIR